MLQSALPIEADDSIVFNVYSSVASLVVLFSGLHMDARGETKYWEREVRPTSDRLITTTSTVIGKCFLISVSATLRTGNADRGQCYVRAFIRRGSGSTSIPVYQLLQGYVSDNYSPCYPLGRMEGPLEGPGMIRSVTGTNPAAGVEILETVPTGARWLLHAFKTVLVASATAANRRPRLSIDDGTIELFRQVNLSAQVANTTVIYSYSPIGVNQATASTIANELLPSDLYLAAGYRISTDTLLFDSGDNWGAPQMLVEEWLEA